MGLTEQQLKEVSTAGEQFLLAKRPPKDMRHQLDLIFRVEGQSVLVYEIRPRWSNPSEIMEIAVAKTTFVKTSNHWKIFWMRANMKWHGYAPVPTVKTIEEFFAVVSEDKHCCFFG